MKRVPGVPRVPEVPEVLEGRKVLRFQTFKTREHWLWTKWFTR
jgi:hypothetical protein